jgi:iron(III) transport system permease protein
VKQSAFVSKILSTIWILGILFVLSEAYLRFLSPPSDTWLHLRQVILPNVFNQTLTIMVLSSLLAGVLGIVSAFLIVMFDFRGRKYFRFFLYLPLAIPPYIAAYVVVAMLSYTGIIQQTLRQFMEVNPHWFEIPAMALGVYVFALTLFPYVYIAVKAFLEKHLTNYIETARTLSKRNWSIFLTIALPLSLPALIGGMVLVGLEILGDYGTVLYLGIPTFSTAIFRSWFSLRDFDSALRLSGILMTIVLVVLLIEHVLRKNIKQIMPANARALKRKQLTGWRHVLVVGYFSLFLLLALILPVSQLVYWAWLSSGNIRWANTGSMLVNTMTLGFVVTISILVIALIIANFTRLARGWYPTLVAKITMLGYSIPGSVIAILVLYAFILLSEWFNISVLTGISMLVFGLIIRYLGLGYQNLEWGFKKIGLRHNEIAQTLGKSYTHGFVFIDVPLLKPAIITAAALVFVDVIKELPLTLNLRPFNFHTLATQVYQYASDERLVESAIPSLMIIGVSILFLYPVITLVNKED